MKSIIQTQKECYLCRLFYGGSYTVGLEEHHVFEGIANRSKSEEWGMKVWLCPEHHRTGQAAVHFNKQTAMYLKCKAQQVFEQEHTREEFIEQFGRSYL